jgi:hypothetical protein
MTGGPLEIGIVVAALALAAACLLTTALHRPTGIGHVVAVALVEAAVLVQVALAATRLASGEGPDDTRSTVTFIGYLVGASIVLPVGVAWSIVDRTRWGPGVIAVAALVLPVLILRLQQIWRYPVG